MTDNLLIIRRQLLDSCILLMEFTKAPSKTDGLAEKGSFDGMMARHMSETSKLAI